MWKRMVLSIPLSSTVRFFCLGKQANGKALNFWTKSSENNGKWAQGTETGKSRTGKGRKKIRKGKRPRFYSIKRLHIFDILKAWCNFNL